MPASAVAHSYTLGDIAIGHVWAPPPESGATSVPVYGAIANRSDSTVRLLSASASVADQVRFRTMDNGVVSWPETIDVSPDKPLGMAPWREHIWLSGLTKPLTEGDSFDLVLDFGNKGSISVIVMVEDPSGH